MSELIPLDKAAKMLGMSADRLKEMVSSNQIFGYRDGTSWKFKQTELDRFADEFAIDIKSASSFGAGLLDDDAKADLGRDAADSDDDFLSFEESDELLLSDDDFELSSDELSDPEPAVGKASGGKPSGKSKSKVDDDSAFDSSDSSLLLDDDSNSSLSDSDELDGNVDLGDNSDMLQFDNDEADVSHLGNTDDDDDLLFGDSSLDLALNDDQETIQSKAPNKAKKDDSVFDEDLLLDDETGSTGKLLKAMSEKVEDSKSSMNLNEDDLFDDDLKLADSDSLADAIDLSSDFEDSDIVLEDSDSSSELVLESNDSINLSANNSGISLSDSLELGGSDIDDLELPDDDMISLAEAADADAATMMQEDDFNLTPFEDDGAEDNSGSQVIALDDSDLFAGDSESTLLADGDLGASEAMLDNESGMTTTLAPVGVPMGTEFPYTVWQVVALSFTSLFLALGLMISYDVARNLWMPSNTIANDGLLGIFASLFGG